MAWFTNCCRIENIWFWHCYTTAVCMFGHVCSFHVWLHYLGGWHRIEEKNLNTITAIAWIYNFVIDKLELSSEFTIWHRILIIYNVLLWTHRLIGVIECNIFGTSKCRRDQILRSYLSWSFDKFGDKKWIKSGFLGSLDLKLNIICGITRRIKLKCRRSL